MGPSTILEELLDVIMQLKKENHRLRRAIKFACGDCEAGKHEECLTRLKYGTILYPAEPDDNE